MVEYAIRELVRKEDLEEHFRLRYKVYAIENNYLPESPLNVDITLPDAYSRHFGLFAVTEDVRQQIGGIRIIYSNRRSTNLEKILEIAQAVGVDKRILMGELRYLPSEAAFDLHKSVSKSIREGKLSVEFGRGAVNREFRGRKFYSALLDYCAAEARLSGDSIAVGSCSVGLRGFYEQFGYKVVEEAEVRKYPENGIDSVAVIWDFVNNAKPPHNRVISNLVRMISSGMEVSICGEGCLERVDYMEHAEEH